ncbi:MAG: glycosyltransferase family 4 protein [Patescibacteria group bacterium]|nr:glycosyltransferase family 4 protein [Patescibacteria group bacterium]MDD5294708.1 glycosyltransferase family 4 protein [Patescibacteria group bacterium]MDD5554214.1 glycosyltransferase family 4 protein [Patescibacteria group bacterium]
MKIAQIVCIFPPYKSGIGNVAYDFSEMLFGSGNEITVFTPDRGQTLEEKHNFKIIFLKPWLKMGLGAFLPQLFFKLPGFDIVYLHYPFFGTAEVIWLAKILFGKKFKLIIHFHMDVAGLSFFAKILSLPTRIIKNSLFRKADIITYASLDYVKNSDIAKIYKRYPAKFKEIPFGVDTNKFTPATTPKNNNIKNILFVGALDKAHYFKGVNILLKAISRFQISDFRFQIAGDGDLKQSYIAQAKKLNISDKVKFLGKVSGDELPKIYQQADLFVLPSINKNEAFGLVLLEAMASGVPVIASDLPGVRTVFASGKQGLLVKPGDAEDLKNKIEKILSNEEKRKIMGREARALALEKYSWQEVSKKLNETVK